MDYYERLDFVFPLLISPQITDNSENVVNLQFGELIEQDQQESLSKNMFNHVKRLVMERDDYAEVILRFDESPGGTPPDVALSPRPSCGTLVTPL